MGSRLGWQRPVLLYGTYYCIDIPIDSPVHFAKLQLIRVFTYNASNGCFESKADALRT